MTKSIWVWNRNDVVDVEHGQHHGRQRFAWDAQREQWDHRRAGHCIVRGLRRDEPLWRAFAEKLRRLGGFLRVGVGHELRCEFANAGHHTHQNAEPGRHRGHAFVEPHFFQSRKHRTGQAHRLGAFIRLGQEQKRLTEREDPQHNNDEVKTGRKPCLIKGETAGVYLRNPQIRRATRRGRGWGTGVGSAVDAEPQKKKKQKKCQHTH